MLELAVVMSLGAAMVRVGNRQQVGRAGIACGERCRLRLDDQPHGNQVGGGNAGHALHDVGKFARFAIDERAAADVPLDHPVMRDRFDRPAHGVAGDAVLHGEVALGRQSAGRRPFACGDAPAQGAFDRAGHRLGQRI